MASNTKQFIAETFKTEGYLKDGNDFVFICPRVYWMAFPTESKIKELSSFLNATFGGNYYIWNLSENTYDTDMFRNQVIAKRGSFSVISHRSQSIILLGILAHRLQCCSVSVAILSSG